MNKFFKVVVVSSLVLLMSGCGEKKEVLKTCTLTSNNSAQGYKMDNEYKIYAKGDVVEKVVTTETVISDSDEILDYFEEYIDESYSQINDVYGGYDYDIEKTDGKLVAETTIDYTKMDLDKYVKDNSVMKNYVNDDNEFSLDGVISIYETMGATCE